MTAEETQMEKRLLELANTAYERNIPMFSDFLNLNEYNVYENIKSKLSFIHTESFGGYELAERRMVAFLPDALVFCTEYPFTCLKMKKVHQKFAEELSHRDYLGSLMNLGIERSKLGDILIEETGAYLFCTNKLADYVIEEVCRVRHTTIVVEKVELQDFSYEPRYVEVTGTVASVRLDALLSLAFGASRSSLSGFIEGGKVFVNGKMITSNGYNPKEGDIISLRQMGRFRYMSQGGTSKKGRSYVTLYKYV